MTFFSIFIVFAKSVYLGLDIGSYFSKASITENNGIPSIYHNSNGSPNTPSFLAFRSKSNFDWRKNKSLLIDEVGLLYPSFGKNALQIMETRPWMGSGFWPLTCNINSDESKKYTMPFRMNSSASRIQYEDSLILFLKKYIDSIIENTDNIKDICFVFPATFLIPQRNIFEYALKNFGIEKFHNIDDVDAVSYVYAIDHSDKFQNNPKTVLFIDIGGLSIKSYVARFEKEKKGITVPRVFRYSYVINRTEGGSHITRRIINYIKEKIGIKKVTDAEFHRLFKAAEKMKIDLTSHDSTFTIIENIGGIDYQFSMNKSELEPCIAPLIKVAADVARKASKNIQFDDIEIIGGTSKIEYVVKSLSEVLHHKILQSLPAEESLAIGAGYSNSFRHNDRFVPVEITEEKSVYSIELLTLNSSYSICKKGEKCVDKIEVPNDAQVMLFNYGEDEIQKGQIVTGFGFYLSYIEEGYIKINFKQRPFRVQNALSCVENSCTENKIDPLEPPKQLSEIFKMFMNPKLIVERLNVTREQLTNFTYLVLYQVEKNQSFRSFTNYTQRLEIIRCAEKHKKWLLNDAKKVTQPINFTLRLNELKKLVFPVYQRIRDNNTLFDELNKLHMTIQNGYYEIVNRSDVNKTVLADFINDLRKGEEFLNNTIDMTFEEPGWKSYSVSANDVKKVNEDLKFKYNKIQFENPNSSNKNQNSKDYDDYWKKFKDDKMNYQSEFEENNEKMQSYEDFIESKKDPFSTDDL